MDRDVVAVAAAETAAETAADYSSVDDVEDAFAAAAVVVRSLDGSAHLETVRGDSNRDCYYTDSSPNWW